MVLLQDISLFSFILDQSTIFRRNYEPLRENWVIGRGFRAKKNKNIVIGRKWRSAHDAVDKKTPLVYYILVADSTYR